MTDADWVLVSTRAVIAAFVASIVFASAVENRRWQSSLSSETPKKRGARRLYTTFLFGVVPGLLLVERFFFDQSWALSSLFSLMLSLSVYVAFLLLLLPWLRRHLSSFACSQFWLLPHVLYIPILIKTIPLSVLHPLLVFRVPASALQLALVIWLVGFAAVELWKEIENQRLRESLMRESRLPSDRELMQVWIEEKERLGANRISLLCVPSLRTPVSLEKGRERYVLLPERDYSEEQLRLIFRHELVHLLRDDIVVKRYMAFFTAVCWFNPLVWLAARRSAEDLELCCDETVLLRAGDGKRRAYAELLLQTAGDARGFTTCLSASARSLRYRMKEVLHPKRKPYGAVALSLLAFLLLFGWGLIRLEVSAGPVEELAFHGAPEAYAQVLTLVERVEPEGRSALDCADPAALTDYLASLELYPMQEWERVPNSSASLRVCYGETAASRFPAVEITLEDETISLLGWDLDHRRYGLDLYRLGTKVDWEYLDCLLAKP